MPQRTDVFDLGPLGLSAGEARRLDLHVAIDPFTFSGQDYTAVPDVVPLRLDVSRMTGNGHALRLRLEVALAGPCFRCLEPASPMVPVDAREVDQPGGGEELSSPYVEGHGLDLRAWAHDALGLALPAQILCRPECLGLCERCGANLNEDPGHEHEPEPDPRWEALRGLELGP